MLSGTAEAERFPRTVLAIIFINQIVPVHVPDVCFVQFPLIISAANDVETRIIGVIIDAVIVKRHQHALVDGVF